MEKKNLRKTEGLPFTLGMAAGVVLLLETILSTSLSPIIAKVTAAYISSSMNISSAASSAGSAGGTVGVVISFLIVPGIFLLLLFLGKNKEKRGSTFAVVWIVIAALSIVFSLFSLVKGGDLQKQVVEAVNTVMPGGYWIENGLALIGRLLIVASCAVFLRRLHEPPVLDVPGLSGQDGTPL